MPATGAIVRQCSAGPWTLGLRALDRGSNESNLYSHSAGQNDFHLFYATIMISQCYRVLATRIGEQITQREHFTTGLPLAGFLRSWQSGLAQRSSCMYWRPVPKCSAFCAQRAAQRRRSPVTRSGAAPPSRRCPWGSCRRRRQTARSRHTWRSRQGRGRSPEQSASRRSSRPPPPSRHCTQCRR